MVLVLVLNSEVLFFPIHEHWIPFQGDFLLCISLTILYKQYKELLKLFEDL